MVRKKRLAAAQAFDEGRYASRLRSPDEEVRGDAVRSLCPCHVGWEAFECHVVEVLRALKDRSRGVRAQALHVLEDAAKLHHAGEMEYYFQESEELLRRRRASSFRPGENGAESRKLDRLRWRARRSAKSKG